MDRLIAQAQTAGDVEGGRRITYLMWQLWADAPDAAAQDLLDEGMSRREAFDFAGAVKAFDALIAYCPDYAEGYNQRAFINYLRQDYAAALPDLNRDAEALAALRKALGLNPWLSERYLRPALEKRVGESL